MIIGIAGRSGSGKDSIGKLLASKLFYDTYAYAIPLKELCKCFIPGLPWYGDKTQKEKQYLVSDLDFFFAEFENTIGLRYDVLHYINIYFLDILENKETVSAREILQYIGTDIVRKYQGYDFWVKLVKSKDNLVVTDVRFENELVDFNIKIHGGISDSSDKHESEQELDDSWFDLILTNEYSTDPDQQLKQLVEIILEKLSDVEEK